ncbi:hypothetical protein, partial [Pseudomonas sp. 34 E 7]|uniref:hypothetical protein n=1 Tax=Pseudomonas sp. 34 E 7 TaxID=1844102 RepID=UPI001C4913DB
MSQDEILKGWPTGHPFSFAFKKIVLVTDNLSQNRARLSQSHEQALTRSEEKHEAHLAYGRCWFAGGQRRHAG